MKVASRLADSATMEPRAALCSGVNNNGIMFSAHVSTMGIVSVNRRPIAGTMKHLLRLSWGETDKINPSGGFYEFSVFVSMNLLVALVRGRSA